MLERQRFISMDGQDIIGYEFGSGFYADVERKCVFVNGSPLRKPLLNMEFEVLIFFLRNPDRTIAPNEITLLKRDLGWASAVHDYVSKIRRKLGVGRKKLLVSVPRKGYRFEGEIVTRRKPEKQAGTELFELSELYFNLHRADSMKESIRQAKEVLRLDPTRIRSHITIAYDYVNLCQSAFAAARPDEAIPQAKAEAEAALEKQPDFSPAFGILGLVAFTYDYNWAEAERLFKRALDKAPREAATLLSYSHLLVASGRFNEAIDCVERAAAAEATDQIIVASRSWIHLLAGKVEKAVILGQEAVKKYGILAPAHLMLGWAYQASNRYNDALRHYERSIKIESSPEAVAALGHLHGILGNRRIALSMLSKLKHAEKNGEIAYLPSLCEALIYVGLQETEEALKSLLRAYEQRCNWLTLLRVEPRWSPLRSKPEFQRIAEWIGIPKHSSNPGRLP